MKRKRIPTWLRRAVIEKCGTKCFYCGKKGVIDKSRPGFPNVLEKERHKHYLNWECTSFIWRQKSMHLDHVIPVSRGGKTELNNLVVACEFCNENKRAKTPDEWEQMRLKKQRREMKCQ